MEFAAGVALWTLGTGIRRVRWEGSMSHVFFSFSPFGDHSLNTFGVHLHIGTNILNLFAGTGSALSVSRDT